jgi:hypothetical protein
MGDSSLLNYDLKLMRGGQFSSEGVIIQLNRRDRGERLRRVGHLELFLVG